MKSLVRTAAVATAAVGIQTLMVFAFTAPAVHTAPHKVPLAVAAPAPARAALEAKLDHAAPGAFTFRDVADETAARAALADRDAYGALVVTDDGPHMLVASGAGPSVATMLTEAAAHLSPTESSDPLVTDVVPAAAKDPHGAAFTALVLPLVMSSLAAGILLTLTLPRLRDRAVGLAVFAAGAGLAVAALAGHGEAFLPGSYLALSAAVGAGGLAVAGFTVGAAALLGPRGFALSGVTMMLLANPLSGAPSAPEMLPTPWGALGQDLPPGAAATLIRSVAFFDGHGAAHAITVLTIWAAVGGAALVLAAARNRRTLLVGGDDASHTAAPASEPVPTAL